MKEIQNLITQFRGKTFSSTKDAEDWLAGKISSLLEIQKKEMGINIGQLRQWLNEERITDPKKMVTSEEIKVFLNN